MTKPGKVDKNKKEKHDHWNFPTTDPLLFPKAFPDQFGCWEREGPKSASPSPTTKKKKETKIN